MHLFVYFILQVKKKSRMLVVISGGSQGLGAALARIYVQRGHSVVLVARTESKLKATVKELETLHSTNPLADMNATTMYVAADVSDPAQCERVFDQIGEVPDLVLCCAGAATPGLFVELTTAQLETGLKTVYETVLYFSHAAMKRMTAAKDKHEVRRSLVLFSSTTAVFPFIGYSSYAPGKAAIRALADILRQECLPHNIRVCHVLPGSMDTEGFAQEELTKPHITRVIEGKTVPLPPDAVATHILRKFDAGNDTIYTDAAGWILGSMMLGYGPRYGYGILQAALGVFFALFGTIVGWFMNREIAKDAGQRKRALPSISVSSSATEPENNETSAPNVQESKNLI